MNDRSLPHSRVCCNILFEQVFFAVLADLEHRDVASVLGRGVKDEGYSGREFCDLSYWSQRPFFHLLGGHKRNPYNVEMLRRTLLRLYPDVLDCLTALFSSSHRRFSVGIRNENPGMSIERSIAVYEDYVDRTQEEWDKLSNEELLSWERRSAESVIFKQSDDEIRKTLLLERNPWQEWYHFPSDFHPGALRLLHGRFGIEEQYPLTDVVMVPCLYERGMREIPIVDMQIKALRMLQECPMAYGDLESELMAGYTLKSEESVCSWRRIVERQIAELIYKGVLVVKS